MAQVVAVGIRAADQDSIFLNHAEAGRCLACAGQCPLPALCEQRGDHAIAFRGDAGAAGEDVESDPFAEEDFADWAADCGAFGDWVDGFAFFDVPFNSYLLVSDEERGLGRE